ncbi:(deoxy)nucleoside triphosphate pyrophosphohydrolase [Candidatus Woesearchaeota archaeon]|nr:(deoxy)nucleoside triphosphate pyrophosphohydrolase [Candidatus Woesearchaeota archaeon]
MTHPILVTAAIIEKDGTYLITQRLDKQHNCGRWEFPGGKVEFGEDPRSCLEREIEEELKIKVRAGALFEYSSHVYDEKKHIILLGIHCDYVSGEIQKHDIADFAWVTPAKMAKYDITEADLPFVEKLK